jgi:hypothetical protein
LFRESHPNVSNLHNSVEMKKIYNSHRLKGIALYKIGTKKERLKCKMKVMKH